MGDTHNIGIAEIKIAKCPDKLRTVLGSCVGVAIFDRVSKVGGLAHVMLPDSSIGKGDKGKFADTAVDALIVDVAGAGGEHKRLMAKISGGASMFGTNVDKGIGERNIEAVKARLKKHMIRLAAEDVGGTKGRRMILDPASGEVTVQVIGAEPVVI
ncbi:MAG: chemotaxis protein CheD [Phycisphaerales bacterium]|nr:chemotaxis protein CheD [Phycisphaerales bacterium]MCB9862171.1 chemotaxis protein CheD [Phycisphaerales bacterium]